LKGRGLPSSSVLVWGSDSGVLTAIYIVRAGRGFWEKAKNQRRKTKSWEDYP